MNKHLATKWAILAACSFAVLAPSSASADIIAQWTFETSVPSTGGPHAAELGSNAATSFASSNTGGTFSNPAGNGSAESFSSNGWNVGEYYQFSTSTIGFNGLNLKWDQTSSGTGPREFIVQYSTDGTLFTPFGSTYAVLENGVPNTGWSAGTPQPAYGFSVDLSSVTALDEQASVFIRLVNNSTVSANGGVVAAGGTDRVDNFTIEGTSLAAVPEPSTYVLCGLSLAGMGFVAVRRRRQVQALATA